MSIPITLFSGGTLSSTIGAQAAYTLLGATETNEEKQSLWDLVNDQCDLQVNLCLEKVGDQVIMDLATETADYLVDYPDLAEDYVLVIVDDPTLDGYEARAFRRDDLLENLESPRKEEVEEILQENTLFYHTEADEVPATPADDEKLLGLAAQIQGFLDKNRGILDILEREGLLAWS